MKKRRTAANKPVVLEQVGARPRHRRCQMIGAASRPIRRSARASLRNPVDRVPPSPHGRVQVVSARIGRVVAMTAAIRKHFPPAPLYGIVACS